jgi:predicted hydrolase (HD superfamily)
MATYGHTFTSGDTLTPTKLNAARTVTEIVNADINASAAIVGTKIDPDFGAQAVDTTGNVTASRLVAGGGASRSGAINHLHKRWQHGHFSSGRRHDSILRRRR